MLFYNVEQKLYLILGYNVNFCKSQIGQIQYILIKNIIRCYIESIIINLKKKHLKPNLKFEITRIYPKICLLVNK